MITKLVKESLDDENPFLVPVITKAEINKLFKEAGYQFIKLDNGDRFSSGTIYKNSQGKRVKGFRGGSIGPMTVTSAHLKHNDKKVQKIKSIACEYAKTCYLTKNGLEMTFLTGPNKLTTYSFTWQLYPTHTHSANLDSMYETYYLVGNSIDSKIN